MDMTDFWDSVREYAGHLLALVGWMCVAACFALLVGGFFEGLRVFFANA
jgi:hypothetical protein